MWTQKGGTTREKSKPEMPVRSGLPRRTPMILGGTLRSPPQTDGCLNQIVFKSKKIG